MNPLDDYPAIRKVLYIIQWITNGVTGVLGVYFASAEASVPKWFVITVAILAFVWTYTGVTAAGNTPPPRAVGNAPGAPAAG